MSDGALWYSLLSFQPIDDMRLGVMVHWCRRKDGEGPISHFSVRWPSYHIPEMIWGCQEDVVYLVGPYGPDRMLWGCLKGCSGDNGGGNTWSNKGTATWLDAWGYTWTDTWRKVPTITTLAASSTTTIVANLFSPLDNFFFFLKPFAR